MISRLVKLFLLTYDRRNSSSIPADPYTRPLNKYDCLGTESQISMFGYVKRYIKMVLERGTDRRNLLATLLQIGDNAILKDMESYVNELL